MNGGVPNKGLNEKLLNILNQLAIDSDLLDNSNYTQYIMFLLQAGADPNTKGQDGKTLSYYLDEKLLNILNQLAIDSNLLDNSNYTQYIMFLLGAGANPNTQTRNGKTLLHYVAERNDIDGIRYFLEVIKANPSMQDKSGKTPFEYVTERECRQAIKDLGYDLDDSHENEGNPTTPDGSVDDCSNSSGDDSQIESVKLSDCNTEEDSNCSSSDNLCNDDKNDNEKDDKETVTNLILEEIEGVLSDRVKPRDGTKEYIGRVNDITDQNDEDKDEALDIIESITSNLLLEGGKAKEEFFSSGSDTELAQNYRSDYIRNPGEKCGEIENKLISIAYEGIVGRDRQAQKGKLEAVKIDNQCFYMKYSQDSIIEPAKILNHEKAKELNLKVGIIQIGESIVRVEGTKDGKRNYTDVLESSIKMSFTTEVGEINIYLSPSKEGGNKIEVEIDDESEARLNKLKAEKKSLGENCLLGGKSILEAIEDKGFEKNDSVSTESIETIKDVPFTDFTQACSQQINTRAKGK
ncbi:ankyrin repeat domain-containing protein [Wolbachia endosymbiont (group A) of Conops quadrifasciatus]|uniref:ankyrin repeat domain-containing protein n=1 Tax=Wolbachia endosymbiont (group A) of Conops quadrifasciatus TaxID=3066143 RepID=UPI003132E11B